MKQTSLSPSVPKAVSDCHALLHWLIPLLDKFPRNRRFTLGERLESILLQILEHLIDAAYSHDKRGQLVQANCKLALLGVHEPVS